MANKQIRGTGHGLTVKIMLPVLAILVTMNAWLIFSIWREDSNAMERGAIAAAVNTANEFDQIRSYYIGSVVKKVREKSGMKIDTDHATKADTIPTPNMFLEDLGKLMAKSSNSAHVKIYSSHHSSDGKAGKVDVFMKDALEFFDTKTEGEFVRRETVDGSQTIRVAVWDKMAAETCLQCHEPKDIKDKKIRGVLEVAMPIERQVSESRAFMVKITGTVVILLLLVAGSVGWVMVHNVTRPLAVMENAVEKMKDRDLSVQITVKSTDEIGRIAGALNTMVENWRLSMKSVAHGSKAIEASSHSLNQVSERLGFSSRETHSQSLVVASAASEVSKNVAMVATSAEEMSASIQEIAKQTNEAAQVASRATSVADKTNITIAKLGDSSAEIGNVIKTITSIAEQTNLLALNATIEAARAGEAGKGFAVVANEVKELAKQTAKATEEIRAKISGIQGDTHAAVSAIQEISTIIKHINEIQSVIASSVEEQAATMNEISNNSSDAARGSSEIAKNISSVSGGILKSTEAAGTTSEASSELSRLAAELNDVVFRFHLGNESLDQKTELEDAMNEALDEKRSMVSRME